MSLNNVQATVDYSKNSLSRVLWDKTAFRLRRKLQDYWLLCAENTPALAYGFAKLCRAYLETSISL